jgi:head-tail adaptor
MSIKTFLLRKMLSSQMKGVPQADQDKVFAMLEKNPDLFQKIGMEVQEEMKRTGADQMTATMKIVKKYEADLKGLM